MDQKNIDSNNSVMQDGNTKNKKNGKKIIIIVVSILALLCIGLYIFSSYFFNTSKVYEIAFKEGYKSVSNFITYLDEESLDYDLNKDIINNTTSITVDSNILAFSEYNNYPITFNTSADFKNEMLYFDMNIDENNSTLLNIALLAKENNLFGKSDELFDEVIHLFSDFPIEIQEENDINLQNVDKIAEIFFEELYNNLDQDNFKNDKTNIEIDGKETNVKEHIYEFKGSDFKNYIENVLDSMLENEEYINLYIKMTGVSEEDAKETIRNSVDIESIEDIDIELVIYTSGLFNKVAGAKINNTEILKISDDKYVIEDKDLTIYLEKTEDSYKIESDISGAKINIDFKNKKENNTLNSSVDIFFEYQGNNINLEITSETEIGTEIKDFDTDNSVDLTELTSSDLTDIYDNLIITLKGTPFEEIVTYLEIFLHNDDLDTDFDYDDEAYSDEILKFTDTANILLEAVEKAYDDDNGIYSCYTIEYLIDNNYVSNIDKNQYHGSLNTINQGISFTIQIQDSINNLSTIGSIFVLESMVIEDSSFPIESTCPTGEGNL